MRGDSTDFGDRDQVGGLDEERPANAEVRELVADMSALVRSEYPFELTAIEPVSYRTQPVAGTNYFVKAFVTHANSNEKKCIHLRIWKRLARFGPNQLTRIKAGVEADSQLEYF